MRHSLHGKGPAGARQPPAPAAAASPLAPGHAASAPRAQRPRPTAAPVSRPPWSPRCPAPMVTPVSGPHGHPGVRPHGHPAVRPHGRPGAPRRGGDGAFTPVRGLAKAPSPLEERTRASADRAGLGRAVTAFGRHRRQAEREFCRELRQLRQHGAWPGCRCQPRRRAAARPRKAPLAAVVRLCGGTGADPTGPRPEVAAAQSSSLPTHQPRRSLQPIGSREWTLVAAAEPPVTSEVRFTCN
jgi:hypothetical protein